MKQFLCLKDWIGGISGLKRASAGKLYKLTFGEFTDDEGCSIRYDKKYNCFNYGIEVETFEQDGQTWIKHDCCECPVPGDWIIETVSSAGPYRADWWNWDSSQWAEPGYGYRIISTGENEQPKAPSITEVAHRVPESIAAVDPSPVPDIGYYILDDESEAYDDRPLSPQEAAYAEKIAALQPEPQAPVVFPSPALRDMTDTTFASLLGMGQFIGGGE